MKVHILQREKDLRYIDKLLSLSGWSGGLESLRSSNVSVEIGETLIKAVEGVCDPLVRLEVLRKLLTSPGAKGLEGLVLRLFLEDVAQDLPGYDSYRWGLGSILQKLASTKTRDVETYIAIAKNRARFGKAREMIVMALANLNDRRIDDLLIELLNDEEVYGHAIMAIGKRKVARALEDVRSFENDARPWVRSEASKARARIERHLAGGSKSARRIGGINGINGDEAN